MTGQQAPSDHPVFLLAEHLDMTLAAIEDLQACQPEIASVNAQSASARPQLALIEFVNELKRHEMSAIVRVARARELTRTLVRRDKRFAMLGGLFVGGTAALDEAVRGMLDKTANDFTTGADPVGYLRSRGLIDEEAGNLPAEATMSASDDFRIAGSIEIGPLVDLVVTFLNTIELHFDLFPELSEANDVTRHESELVN